LHLDVLLVALVQRLLADDAVFQIRSRLKHML
jgi:hypothetical protein